MTGASPQPPHLAFLGCGAAARTHARVVGRMAPEVPMWFASRDAARAREFARRYGGDVGLSSYEEAFRRDEVTAVVVTTPPHRHLELTLAALEAGKDVIVEKPAFPEPAAFQEVRRAALKAGRRVAVAENYYYKPIRRRVSQLLAQGVVGEPLFVHVNAVKRQRPTGWRADPDRAGGGGLLEGGVHWVNFVSNLLPGVHRVDGYRAGGRGGAAESLLLVFGFESGVIGSLTFSWEVPSPLRGLRLSTVYGREGAIWFESNGLFLVARGRRTRLALPNLRDLGGVRAMWSDILDSLATGREPEMTLDMAERDVRLVGRAYRTAREIGAWRGDHAPERDAEDGFGMPGPRTSDGAEGS